MSNEKVTLILKRLLLFWHFCFRELNNFELAEQATEDQDAPPSPEIHFEPIVSLPKVELKSLEENEEALLKL